MERSKRGRQRLLVVRSGERAFPTSDPKIEVVECSTHSIENVSVDPSRVAGPFDLTLFTSRTAVERFFADPRLVPMLSERIVAVGSATAEKIRAYGRSRVEEAGGSAARILERLPSRMTGVRILLPRGEDSSDELPQELERRGAKVAPLTLYRKRPRAYDPALDAEIVKRPFDVFVATSPSAVRWLFEGAAPPAAERLRRTPSVALGPSTRRTLEKRGVNVITVAEPPSFETAARIAASLAAHGRAK